MSQSTDGNQQERLQAAFADNERTSVRLGGLVRATATLAIAIWVAIENADWERSLWYGGWILLFSAVGLLLSWLAHTRRYRGWMIYAAAAADAVIFVCIVMVPVPFEPFLWPRQLQLTHGVAIYAVVILLAASFIHSPRFAIWSGAWLAGCWLIGNLWVMGRPDTLFLEDIVTADASWDEFIAAVGNPYLFRSGHLIRDIVVLLAASAILAVAAQRVRGLVRRQVRGERQRANLARYFSPNLVDELASREDIVVSERRQSVGILFVDIVGFTALAEEQPAEEVIALLREFQRRVEGPVFANGGTLDKFIGDAVMATFGTPDTGPSDAGHTLTCARDTLSAMAEWNGQRAARGEPAIDIGIGAHYGTCVVGDVGGEHRLEFTVIGDPVNVASRLERQTRSLGTDLVVSDDLVSAAMAEDAGISLDWLEPAAPVALRGRGEPQAIWVRPPPGPTG